MSPRKVIEKSQEKGLNIIAVCDHNSVENAGAAMRAGHKHGIHVLPGMEICSREEVHILAVFETLDQGMEMQEYIYAHLPGENRAEFFGYQIIANENDEVLGENLRLLIGATTLGLKEIVEKTHQIGGLSIAAHVDRQAFGLISQLGFIPPDLALDGVEVSFRVPLKTAKEKIHGIKHLSCITSSDAHFPDDIGRAKTSFFINSKSESWLEEIRFALHGLNQRKIEI